MQNKEFYFWFTRYQQQAQILNERRLIVLVGENAWSTTLLKSIDTDGSHLKKVNRKTWLVYGESEYLKANISKQRFRDKLGSESHFVVFQDKNLSIDAIAGLSGTLVAGGVFFLLIDELSQLTESLFYQRFFQQLSAFSQHVVINQSKFTLPNLTATRTPLLLAKSQVTLPYNCLTQEQVVAVDAIIKVFKGKRNRPLILTADRGRGKSSALAIACGHVLNSATKDNMLRIVITAIDLSSLSVFFRQLTTSLPAGKFQRNKFTVDYGVVEFIPIDQLLKVKVAASLVLVDEAAAMPIYLLEALLVNYSRLVFSSTIHGYEGAGRGFTLKFQKTLAQKYPQWRNLHLNEPIRWRINDPLEALVFESCLLNAELPTLPDDVKQQPSSILSFKHFSATELAQDEVLLKQVIAVLVTAHYQTKPSDVRMLLDNKQMQLVCLLAHENKKQYVIAVALLINEGRTSDDILEAQTISAVSHGKRRLKNHFVPQSLLTQCGIKQAFDFYYMRVMRIAVHPQLQQQGIGTKFLNKMIKFSVEQGADFIASSFGVTQVLLSFWLKNDFQIARIGFSKDKASGEQSALVLKALSSSGQTALTDINTEFYRSFDYLLVEEYKGLAAELVQLILQHCPLEACTALSARDHANVEAFALGYRQYSSCVFSLHLWLKYQLSSLKVSKQLNLLVLISRIMQKHTITEVCNMYGLTGKKELEAVLSSKISQLLTS